MLTTTHAHVDVISTGAPGQVVNVTFQSHDSGQWQVVSIDLADVETPLAAGIDYSIVEPVAPLPNLGSITTLIAPTAGHTIRVRRVVDLQQVIDLITQGAYLPASLEKGLDLIVMMIQQTAEGTLPVGTFLHGNLPNAAAGVYHALATNLLPGFYDSADKVANDGHRGALGANVHAETPGSIGAAPASHVGSRDLVAGHPLATAALNGMYPATHFAIVSTLPTVLDPRNVFFDDFDGGGLNGGLWTRSVSGAPTASMQADEYGAYRETTPAGAGGAIIYSRGPSAQRNPVLRMRIWLGRVGPALTSVQYRFGFSAVPLTAHGADTDFAYFWWDGATMWCRSKALSGENAVSFATPSDAYHEYEIQLTATTCVFLMDGAEKASFTSDIPTSTTALARFFDILNTAALSRTIDIDYCESFWTRAY